MNGKMRVVVDVGGSTIAESSDLGLCAAVLRLIDAEEKGTLEVVLGSGELTPPAGDNTHVPGESSAESHLASDLNVSVAELIGGIDPSVEPPFIRVNKRNWEAMLKAFSRKGPGSVAPFAILMTCLAVWKDYADLGRATYREGGILLKALGLEDKNRRRSIANCPWLMERGDEVALNPAEISRALEVLGLLCQTDAKAGK